MTRQSENSRIKRPASETTLLILRRYGGHDIEDLKGLIELARRWIELKKETEMVRARLLWPRRYLPE